MLNSLLNVNRLIFGLAEQSMNQSHSLSSDNISPPSYL